MITQDPLFKGMTRKAALFGVPLFPLFFTIAALIMTASIFTAITKQAGPWVIVIIATFPIIGTMRLIVKHDEDKFKLLWMWFLSRLREKNFQHWKAVSYGPVSYQKRRW
jgi:type IV secretion system protein VirB3